MSDRNIYYLHELSDYKVASEYPDVRGWDVKDKENKTIGKVDNLLVNKKALRVVYLDVEVDSSIIEDGHEPLATSASDGVHEFINKDGENHLILPIGLVWLDEENKVVQSNEIPYDIFKKTKRISKGSIIDPGYELTVYRQYIPTHDLNENQQLEDNFYDRKEFKRGQYKGM